MFLSEHGGRRVLPTQHLQVLAGVKGDIAWVSTWRLFVLKTRGSAFVTDQRNFRVYEKCRTAVLSCSGLSKLIGVIIGRSALGDDLIVCCIIHTRIADIGVYLTISIIRSSMQARGRSVSINRWLIFL